MWREKLKLNKTNTLAALYPSCKFWVVCLYSLCSFIIGTVKVNGYSLYLILWFFIVPILCLASGVFSKFLKSFSKIIFMVAIIFVVQSLFVPKGSIIGSFWIFNLYEGGLDSAIMLSFSIMNMAGIFVWMFATTENKELSANFENAGMNYKVSYVFISTLQMIEILGKNSQTIMNAQKARGVETDGNLLLRAKAFFPSLVPLILGAITSTEERVLTLESKGFDVNGPKTRLFQIDPPGKKETVVKSIAIVVTLAVAIWRVSLWVL